jgi:hypothetical protein
MTSSIWETSRLLDQQMLDSLKLGRRPQPIEHYGKDPGPGCRVLPALLHRPRRADQHGLEFAHTDVRPDHAALVMTKPP